MTLFLPYSIQSQLSANFICTIVNYANQTVISFGEKMCYIVVHIVSGNKISYIGIWNFRHIAQPLSRLSTDQSTLALLCRILQLKHTQRVLSYLAVPVKAGLHHIRIFNAVQLDVPDAEIKTRTPGHQRHCEEEMWQVGQGQSFSQAFVGRENPKVTHLF